LQKKISVEGEVSGRYTRKAKGDKDQPLWKLLNVYEQQSKGRGPGPERRRGKVSVEKVAAVRSLRSRNIKNTKAVSSN